MELILYHESETLEPVIEDFIDSVHNRQLTLLASNLLEEGLSPRDILEAVRRATTACQAAGIPVREHFKPVYSSYRGSLVKDCKLSRLGYGLVLINARPDNEATADMQVKLLRRFLNW